MNLLKVILIWGVASSHRQNRKDTWQCWGEESGLTCLQQLGGCITGVPSRIGLLWNSIKELTPRLISALEEGGPRMVKDPPCLPEFISKAIS